MEELQAELAKLRAENAAIQERLSNTNSGHDQKVEPATAQVCKVSVKLPPFWSHAPAVWFGHVEAQFHLAGITSDTTMYCHLLSQIDSKLATEVEDIVTNPPKDGKYQLLKETIIKRVSVSKEQRVRQLLSIEELGDKKPSQFLRHLRSLAGTLLTDDNLLRELWLRRLPSHVQAILAAQAELGLDKVSELADNILEVSVTTANLCAISGGSTPLGAPQVTLSSLFNRLEDLSKQVAALSSGRSQRPSRNRSSSSKRSSRGNSSDQPGKCCWYHKKFGTKAAKCISPCDWMSENRESNQ